MVAEDIDEIYNVRDTHMLHFDLPTKVHHHSQRHLASHHSTVRGNAGKVQRYNVFIIRFGGLLLLPKKEHYGTPGWTTTMC